jgi:phosphate transport system protein
MEDDVLDDLNEQLFREPLSFMLENTATITRYRLTFVAKPLERIADHATNIGELVLHMVEGKNIRHIAPSVGRGPCQHLPSWTSAPTPSIWS